MSSPYNNYYRATSTRSQNVSYADLMKPDEDWRMLPDAAERRKIQNRLAQRAYRRNMRDRTKELEDLKRELATLKKEPTAPRMSPARQSPQMQPAAGMPANDFGFDANMAPSWNEPFPTTQFNDNAMHLDSYFTINNDLTPGQKRRRTSSISDMQQPTRNNSGISVSGHQRSRSQTPMSSPPMVNASVMQDSLVTPPMQEFYPSPCNFDLGADVTNPMNLPDINDTPHFSLDGFTDCAPATTMGGSLDSNGLWSPPMTGGLFGSFLTPPQTDLSSPPTTWQNSGTPSTVKSETMGRSRSCSSASNVSPFSAATSQFSSPALSASKPANGLNLNLETTTNNSTAEGSLTTPTTNQTKSSLLHLAVSGGHTQVLQLLLKRCEIPIDIRDAKGYTALQRAVFAGKMEMVTMLLEAGADFSAGRQDDGAEAAAEQQGDAAAAATPAESS